MPATARPRHTTKPMNSDVRMKVTDLQAVTGQLVDTYTSCSRLNHLGLDPLPSRDGVADLVADLFEVLYPGYGRRQNLHLGNVAFYIGTLLDALHDKLTDQVARAFRHDLGKEAPHTDFARLAEQKVVELFRRLPALRTVLERDVEAAFRGDPAAKSHHEIIFCYPGFEAVSVYRVAHELHTLGVPYIPRMMTEFAHAKTGIDIHPGATIGGGFFIDHGTGVVIGETCEIGTDVKLYQGVTLGALSFDRDDNGELKHGAYKRHPSLENDVVVYANATILGGKTTVGRGSVIGSNVWLTESVPPGTTVVLEKPKLKLKGAKPAEDVATDTYQI